MGSKGTGPSACMANNGTTTKAEVLKAINVRDESEVSAGQNAK